MTGSEPECMDARMKGGIIEDVRNILLNDCFRPLADIPHINLQS